MKNYTVVCTFLADAPPGCFGGMRTRTRTFENVRAEDCGKAAELALMALGDVKCPAVNAVWFNPDGQDTPTDCRDVLALALASSHGGVQ